MAQRTWKDIVEINNKITAEEFPITENNKDKTYAEFKKNVAAKYHVNPDDIKTYTEHDIDFDANDLPFGAESCGININGKPEWYYDMP